MLEWLSCVDVEQLEGKHLYFATLSYGEAWPDEMRQVKADLDRFTKRLRRAHPKAWALWKLEPQERGAPHYHLIIVSDDPIPQSWYVNAWLGACQAAERWGVDQAEKMRKVHAFKGKDETKRNWQRLESWRGVNSYVSKYVGKVVEHDLPQQWYTPGRFWGVAGRAEVPIDLESGELEEKAFNRARRAMRRLLEKRTGRKNRLFPGRGLRVIMQAETSARLLEWASGPLPEW